MYAALAPLLALLIPVLASARAFSLAAEKSAFLLGEPVYLRISSPDSRVPSLEEGTAVLAIADSGHAEFRYRPPMRLRTRPDPDAHAAAKGGTGIRYARLIANEGGLLFRNPGKYRLRLVAAGPPRASEETSAVLSDTLEITVREPSSPQDKRAYAILSQNPGEYALIVYLEGGDQLQKGMAILRDLAAFPNGYARTAAFVLSSNWSQAFTDFQGGANRPPDLGKALSLAQWDKSAGAYVPLRNAYRLRTGAEILSTLRPADPNLKDVRAALKALEATLTPEERAWSRSF